MSVDALVAQVSDLAAQVSRLKQRQNADFTGQLEQITRIVSGPVRYLKSAVILADDPAAGDWTTVDVSDYAPPGVTHVLLQLSFRGNDDGGEVRFRADAESIELNGVFAGITGSGEDLHMKLPPAAFPLSGSSRTFQYCVVEALQALTIELVGCF